MKSRGKPLNSHFLYRLRKTLKGLKSIENENRSKLDSFAIVSIGKTIIVPIYSMCAWFFPIFKTFQCRSVMIRSFKLLTLTALPLACTVYLKYLFVCLFWRFGQLTHPFIYTIRHSYRQLLCFVFYIRNFVVFLFHSTKSRF